MSAAGNGHLRGHPSRLARAPRCVGDAIGKDGNGHGDGRHAAGRSARGHKPGEPLHEGLSLRKRGSGHFAVALPSSAAAYWPNNGKACLYFIPKDSIAMRSSPELRLDTFEEEEEEEKKKRVVACDTRSRVSRPCWRSSEPHHSANVQSATPCLCAHSNAAKAPAKVVKAWSRSWRDQG